MSKIIAAVKTTEKLKEAVTTDADIIFLLNPEINTLGNVIKYTHSKNKKIYIHFDLAKGFGNDKSAVMFAKSLGADGIISTRQNIIKFANEVELKSVQRFFALDSQSVTTIIESVKTSKANMIEIMPGIATKVIKVLKESVSQPIIAGGLIETEEEVENALSMGACAISTGNIQLWKKTM